MNKKNSIFNSLGLARITTISFLTLVVIFVFGVMPALAQLQTGLEYGTYTGLGTQDIRITIMKIIRIFLGLVGIIAIILIMYGGYVWMTSAGNPEKVEQAKKILRNAAIGLLIIFSAFMIVSFIIGVLSGEFGAGPRRPGGGPPPYSDGHLGSGIIESVYPAPYARDVTRDTNIAVTFKVEIDPTSICNDGNSNGQCDNNETLKSGSVYIFKSDDRDNYNKGGNFVDPATVRVTQTADSRTFTFNPDNYLGDGVRNIWYEVRLTNSIKKAGGIDTAFPGVRNFFQWPFEIGTRLDLDPVEVNNGGVFPQPDDEGDNYSMAAATFAVGSIEVTVQPQVAQDAEVYDDGKIDPTSPAANFSVSGAYNCSSDATVQIRLNTNDSLTLLPSVSISGLIIDPALTAANTINIGCGLVGSFAANPSSGGVGKPGIYWQFKVKAQKSADTMKVVEKIYTFGTDIAISTDNSVTAGNIGTKISNDNLLVNSSASGSTVTLTAKTAGEGGNLIRIEASGSWARLCNDDSPPICDANNPTINLSGGSNAVLAAIENDVSDKPRNAVIKIDFNEAVDPTKVDPDPSSFADNTVVVEYYDGITWRPVAGKYLFSNQYQTVEFLPNSQCGVCTNGNPCDDSADCGGGTCNFITNTCGDQIYCLPVLTPTSYEATNYRVIVKAGLLNDCANNDGCLESIFNSCVRVPADNPDGTVNENYDQACNSSNVNPADGTGYFLPRALGSPAGIIDMANNSFNGNRNTFVLDNQTVGEAEGPQTQSDQVAFNLNSANADTQGDDLIWSFYINKELDITPPNITTIGPAINQSAVSLTDPIAATFDELLMGATLKPGSGYRDGYCRCDPTSPNCPSGYTCDDVTSTIGKCKIDSGEQPFCAEDKECSSNSCWNRKYVSLVDRSTFPVGWWITHTNLDNNSDAYADYTVVSLRHTRFAEVTQYGAEFGSGIKDVYQNCYLPSEGPNAGTGTCGTNPNEPYCCNGDAMGLTEWLGTSCNTGY
ncbi:MAG: hypothetical protein A2731_03630 [Candidatus Buchananbacteria bacterium RIFCSPHIGHO2_01_FULL_39_8]|uniref:SbsA Ig-like domain-containing protein n=1 Tax=Candidatus Buchananbacteria bacterium RIFCSPHIGHO2_01_FULL_39_8 TaxID=1797533 RepID=A0A1G1XZX3_9BACT|nr:MAG: hypothetical protein A2731_03630 [Candidatus Buchananbacteria bacterium RIFCSPHIGHO2_01_FULL_39_8]